MFLGYSLSKLTLTHIRLVPLVVVRPVESVLALVTVDALGMVLAIFTLSTALKVSMDVQRQPLLVYRLVVHTLLCVAETVAS